MNIDSVRRAFAWRSLTVSLSICAAAFSGAQIANGSFDIPNPLLSGPNYATSNPGIGNGGTSSAESWFMWNNSATVTDTELLSSTDPFGGGTMLHVTTSGADNGVFSLLGSATTDSASVRVFVLSGSVVLSSYSSSGHVLHGTISSSSSGVWETLFLSPAANPFDELTIYSGPNGGDFYLENASLGVVPEPATVLILWSGVGAVIRRLRKK